MTGTETVDAGEVDLARGLGQELQRLRQLVREERALIRRLERWCLALLAAAGLLGCDTLARVLLWVLADLAGGG